MKIKLHETTFGEEEIQAACEQMRTTNVTMGAKVREFEEQCAAYFGSKYCVMSNSGSSANLLAVAALCSPMTDERLKPGDEVIVPALSWATSVWPIIQYGLVPVFVDCDINTYNATPELIEAAITPKTRAIMVVHVYGNPCQIDAIMGIAKKHNIRVIEDTCESMGATYNNKHVGAFGDIGTMSLYYSHHITTFEGGLSFTDSFELSEQMRILRAHGWSREADNKQMYNDMYPDIDPRFLFVGLGYNLRPTEVQAVIGMKQLSKLDGIINSRRLAHSEYCNGLDKYSDFFLFQEELRCGKSSQFGFGMVLRDDCPFTLKQISSYLQSREVETRPIIAGNIARHPALRTYIHGISGKLENCDEIMQRGFAIGCHQAVDTASVDYVVKCFDDFMVSIA
jgi:CDP-4-dehydro-6-deoxyglucose reductase, E1